jgi:hypothetical protein
MIMLTFLTPHFPSLTPLSYQPRHRSLNQIPLGKGKLHMFVEKHAGVVMLEFFILSHILEDLLLLVLQVGAVGGGTAWSFFVIFR